MLGFGLGIDRITTPLDNVQRVSRICVYLNGITARLGLSLLHLDVIRGFFDPVSHTEYEEGIANLRIFERDLSTPQFKFNLYWCDHWVL